MLQTAVIRETTDDAHDAYERIRDESATVDPEPRDGYRGLVGTPAEVCERIERFGDLGAEVVMLRAEANDAQTVENLVDDVVPEVR